MNPKDIGMNAERRVAEWLTQQGARFTTDRERSFASEFGIPSPDFLVLWPAPMAIDVAVATNDRSSRMKAKRDLGKQLASQIWLSQRFGPYIPRVVMTPGRQIQSPHPFADATVPIDSLTTFDALIAGIRLNPVTQHILKHGQPAEITGSLVSQEEWAKPRDIRMWLSLDSTTESKPAPPAETLAYRLFQATRAKRIETLAAPLIEGSIKHLVRPAIRRAYTDDERWHFSRALGTMIEQTLLEYAAERIHASIKLVTSKLDGPSGIIRRKFHLLSPPNGAPVLMRVMRLSDASANHKLYELIADAWMDRASSPVQIGRQILLMGSADPTGSAPMWLAKSLAQAGWHVFPWDFDEPTPAFVSFIEDLTHD